METWKPIPHWPLYLVSDMGNVKTILSTGKCLSPDMSSHGYPRVYLHDGGKRKRYSIHQLVMITFVGPYPPKHEINHKNGVVSDCRLENLEYVTKNYNQWHCNHVIKTRNSQKGSKHGRSKLTEEKVLQIRAMQGECSMGGVAEMFDVNVPTISMIWNRKTWRHI